ncbi:hypothetical protein SteCoe_242 [Stentor coeruleus]|uniref:Hexose transporter 1 n=1 Tax=Stentor coeruleus TaxID=5963 RepID=A0A1R2D4R6_9CILI|nr:hypothetical protein SteCoe_242 [Stentor coeruleus]
METEKDYNSRLVWANSFHVSLSFFLVGYSLSSFNSSYANIASTLGWEENSIYIPIANSLFCIGSLLGSAIGPKLSHIYGYRKIIIFTCFLMFISSTLSIIPFTLSFCLGRLLVGHYVGIILPIIPIYLNDITPDEMFGKVGPLLQISFDFGMVMTCSLSLFLPSENLETSIFNYFWMFIFALPILFASYQLWYFFIFCKYDSPNWYLRKGKKPEAIKALMVIYSEKGYKKGLKRFEKSDENKDIKSELLINQQNPTYVDVLCKKKYRKMIRMAILMSIIQQFSGICAIILYSTSLYRQVGGSLMVSKVLTLLTFIVNMASGILVIPLLDRYGRKTLLLSGQTGILIDFLILSVVSGFFDTGVVVPAICIFIFFILFTISLGTTYWAFLGEAVNDISLGIGTMCGTVSMVFLSFNFPFAVRYFGISGSFLGFTAILAVAIVYQYFELFETKGKTKQEIQKIVFKDN